MNSDFIDINLLRPPQAARVPAARRPGVALGLALLGLAFLLLLVAGLIKTRNDRELARQAAQLQAMQQGVRQFSVVMTEVEQLQNQITTLAQQAEQLEADAEQIDLQNPALAPFLGALTGALLPRMEITGIVMLEADRFLVQGEAGSDALVVEYISALRQQPAIREVAPRTVTRAGGDAAPGAVRWTIEVER